MLLSRDEKAGALDADNLLAEARQISGLSYFGDERFIVALRRMTRCYIEDVLVDSNGLALLRSTIVRQLVNRARFEADLKAHPEILEEDVSDPIVILGMPRSGTTKAHRMLGADPNLLKTYMWQLVNPAPFPDWDGNGPDPRIAAARTGDPLIQANDDNPELRAGHHYGSEEVQSDLWLVGMTFNDNFYNSWRPPSPSYYHYLNDRTYPSDRDNYEYASGLYRYLQWQQGGRMGRRWLFKNESLLGFVDDFLEAHPKATFVHVHRDPHVSIPSLMKLGTEFSRPYFADIEARDLAHTLVDRFAGYTHRYMAIRDKHNLGDRIMDVQYEQIRTNPISAFRELYERAGHVLAPESEDLMLSWERDNEQGRHGAHTYSLEEFGLTDRVIDHYFGEYIRRFIERR
ncbi:MAG: sulfotransferase [Sphingobium sp.]